MPEPSRSRISNRILSCLSREDFALAEPHLESVDLRKSLERRNKRIDQLYFIETGFASIVANGTGRPSIEVGMIGREGMSGLAIVLGGDRASHATYIQVASAGQRISAANLGSALDRSTTLHRAMLRYAHAFLLQTTTTALANGRNTIEERLARWLLMADDRWQRAAAHAQISRFDARHPSFRGDPRYARARKGRSHHGPPRQHHYS
jgi:CRP-like cAMP-binding protein